MDEYIEGIYFYTRVIYSYRQRPIANPRYNLIEQPYPTDLNLFGVNDITAEHFVVDPLLESRGRLEYETHLYVLSESQPIDIFKKSKVFDVRCFGSDRALLELYRQKMLNMRSPKYHAIDCGRVDAPLKKDMSFKEPHRRVIDINGESEDLPFTVPRDIYKINMEIVKGHKSYIIMRNDDINPIEDLIWHYDSEFSRKFIKELIFTIPKLTGDPNITYISYFIDRTSPEVPEIIRIMMDNPKCQVHQIMDAHDSLAYKAFMNLPYLKTYIYFASEYIPSSISKQSIIFTFIKQYLNINLIPYGKYLDRLGDNDDIRLQLMPMNVQEKNK